MDNKKSSAVPFVIFIIILFLLLLLLGFIIKSKQKVSNVTTKPNTTTTVSTTSSKLLDSILDKITTKNISSEETDLYISGNKVETNVQAYSYSDYKLLGNMIVFNANDINSSYLFMMDQNGKNVINLTNKLAGKSYYGEFYIKNNIIYATSNDLGQDSEYQVCVSKKSKKVIYVERLIYNNGDITKSLYSYTTASQYIIKNNINCSK